MARGKGEGGVYKNAQGLWTVSVELPSRDGKRRRKVIRSKKKQVVLNKLSELKKDLRERGDLPTADVTVEAWFMRWLGVLADDVRPKTVGGYRTVITKHVVPTIGRVKLEKVTVDHVRKVTTRITDELGLSSTYALNAHRIMSAGFEAAYREGKIGRNPAKLMKAPKKGLAEQEAFDVDEAIRVLEHVSVDEVMGARWATALLTGARRGEVIGVEYDRVSFTDDAGELDLSWQLQRLSYAHGCGGACGRRFGGDCPWRHVKVPADYEYRHIKGGLYWTRPKSSAGWRVIPLVDPLKSILKRHIESTPRNPYGLVFTLGGEPIDPDRDTERWKTVLESTGIDKDVVLHGLRHTAVDLLYLAGVPEDIIQQIVGHSSRLTSRGYRTRGKVQQARLNDAMHSMAALFTPPTGEHSDTRGEVAS